MWMMGLGDMGERELSSGRFWSVLGFGGVGCAICIV